MMLIELIVYIGVSTLLLGLAFGALHRCLINSRDLERNSEDIIRALRAGELWRQDVRRASAPPWLDTTNGLVRLEIPQESGPVSYVFAENGVWRVRSDHPEFLLPAVKSSTFQADIRRFTRAWRWEIQLITPKKVVRIEPRFTFIAALPPMSP